MNRTPSYYSLLAVVLSILSSCNANKEEVHPEYRTLVESVYASVTVEPEELYEVFPSASGVLKSVFVEEGDTVTIDQLLAEVEATAPTINAERGFEKKPV